MTSQEIRETVFQWLVDDTNVDETQELVLLNIAYDRINAMRAWSYLDKSQASQTLSATTSYAQPTDFMYLDRLQVTDGTTYNDVKIVPFVKRFDYNNTSRVAFLDAVNSQITFTTAPDSDIGQTLVWTYQYQPSQLTNSTSPVFPRQFHALVGYEMARMYFFNDQPEKDRAWNKELMGEYAILLKQMKDWDTQVKLKTEGEWLPDTYMIDPT
jgi:hypothetical protein